MVSSAKVMFVSTKHDFTDFLSDILLEDMLSEVSVSDGRGSREGVFFESKTSAVSGPHHMWRQEGPGREA